MELNFQDQGFINTASRSTDSLSIARERHFALKLALVLLSFALLWFILLNQLRVEWTVNPQYSYGWIVPLLCLGLLARRWLCMLGRVSGRNAQVSSAPSTDFRPVGRFLQVQTCIVAFLAFLI